MTLILLAVLIPLVLIGLLAVAERLDSSTWIERRGEILLLVVAGAELVAATGLYLDPEGPSWTALVPLAAALIAIGEILRRRHRKGVHESPTSPDPFH